MLFNVGVYPPMDEFVYLSHTLFCSLAYLCADVFQRTAIAEGGDGALGRSKCMTENAGLGELRRITPNILLYIVHQVILELALFLRFVG